MHVASPEASESIQQMDDEISGNWFGKRANVMQSMAKGLSRDNPNEKLNCYEYFNNGRSPAISIIFHTIQSK